MGKSINAGIVEELLVSKSTAKSNHANCIGKFKKDSFQTHLQIETENCSVVICSFKARFYMQKRCFLMHWSVCHCQANIKCLNVA